MPRWACSGRPEPAPGSAPRRPRSLGRQCACRPVRWRPAASGLARAASAPRSAGHRQGGQPRPGVASRSARMPGSPSATSTILVRPDAPATSVTAPRRTPNAAATAASAASVALPSTARARTRTIRAPHCPPPTPGRAEPGRTRIVIRTCLVCGRRRDVPDDHGRERMPASRAMPGHRRSACALIRVMPVIRTCRNEHFIRAHISARSGIRTHTPSTLRAIVVKPSPSFWQGIRSPTRRSLRLRPARSRGGAYRPDRHAPSWTLGEGARRFWNSAMGTRCLTDSRAQHSGSSPRPPAAQIQRRRTSEAGLRVEPRVPGLIWLALLTVSKRRPARRTARRAGLRLGAQPV
jgi:hypothetical protein